MSFDVPSSSVAEGITPKKHKLSISDRDLQEIIKHEHEYLFPGNVLTVPENMAIMERSTLLLVN